MFNFNEKRILVVVAHPDDELLGCGATMNKLIHEQNCQIRAVILGEGITSRSDKRDPKLWSKQLKTHRDNIESARQFIGYQSTGIYDFPDNRFDSVALLDIIKVIEKEKSSFDPEIIFTHHGGDVNVDHQRTFQAVMTATRPMKDEKAHTVISFETPSGTEWIPSSDPRQFVPNLYFEITEEGLNSKIKGMEAYEFEKREFPHPRSPKALKIKAQHNGIMIGKNLAEAFRIIRCIH